MATRQPVMLKDGVIIRNADSASRWLPPGELVWRRSAMALPAM
jgi:hypothetical protein